VLVHYLNFPYLDDGNRVTSDLALNRRCEQWEDLAKEDVVEQLRPMCKFMKTLTPLRSLLALLLPSYLLPQFKISVCANAKNKIFWPVHT